MLPENVKDVQSFYDREADSYYSSRYVGETADNLVWRSRADLVLELVGRVEGVVVDLGCGPGVLAPRLTAVVDHLISADLSLEMLQVGRKNLGGDRDAGWVNCELASLPFRTGSIAALLVIGVFGLATEPSATIAEFARVVRPGGRLVLQVPNSWNPRRVVEQATSRLRLSRKAAYEDRLARGGIGPRPFTSSEMEHMLGRAGFAVARRRYYDFRVPFLSRLSSTWDARTATALHRLLNRERVLGQLGEGMLIEAVRLA